jgi:hypothetical protein
MRQLTKFFGILTMLFVVISVFNTTLHAQLSTRDSLLYHTSIQNAKKVYYDNIGDQAAKYNGSQYLGYTVSFSDGQPYFKANELVNGSILYDGVKFDKVQIMYDEVAGCVIMQDSSHRIQLVNERLSSFSLHESNFERLEKKGNSPLISSGFYQVLHKGNISLYKKETKKMIDKFSNANELAVLFEIHHYYYVLKDGHYYEINKKKDFLTLFTNREKEITKYINDQHLNFRKDKDEMMTKVIEFYNQLTK